MALPNKSNGPKQSGDRCLWKEPGKLWFAPGGCARADSVGNIQETFRTGGWNELSLFIYGIELSRIQDDWCWEIWIGKAFGFMSCGGCFRRTIASNFSNCNSLAAATHHFGTNWASPSTIVRWIRRCGWIIFHLFWLQFTVLWITCGPSHQCCVSLFTFFASP